MKSFVASLLLAFFSQVGEANKASYPPYNPGAFFESMTVMIPHDQKIHRGGEDSAHVCDTLITVADGVGGWEKHGVNPGHFSKTLTRAIRDIHLQAPQLTTRELTVISHENAANKFQGSCTTVTVKIESQDTISTTNIGDSGYSLYHVVPNEGESSKLNMYYRSEEGQKQFNFPYQIGSVGDDPNTFGEDKQHVFEHGDVLLVYSDGVSDNLFTKDFTKCFKDKIDDYGIVTSYSEVADCIARQAYHLGKNPTYQSPFAKGAAKYNMRYDGGKHDDITITVAQIFQNDKVQDRKAHTEEYFEKQITVYTSSPLQSDKPHEVKSKKVAGWDEL